MNQKKEKQIGDLVSITRGQYKGQDGILRDRSQRGWLVELQSREIVNLMFPFVRLKAKKGAFEATEPWCTILDSEAAATPEDVQEEPEVAGNVNLNNADATREETINDTPSQTGVPDDVGKMTVMQLRDKAKQKGIAIARTKDDFLRIIKEINPEEDLEPLKGKVLFDRVSELHISRLRSKEDLQKLLSK